MNSTSEVMVVSTGIAYHITIPASNFITSNDILSKTLIAAVRGTAELEVVAHPVNNYSVGVGLTAYRPCHKSTELYRTQLI